MLASSASSSSLKQFLVFLSAGDADSLSLLSMLEVLLTRFLRLLASAIKIKRPKTIYHSTSATELSWARLTRTLSCPDPKITLASFTVSSSLRSLSFSFSNTAGMISLRLVLWVNLWPYFSNRGRRTSTFHRGIPPVRTHSTISNRNKRMSAGNVDPLGCSRMSHLLRHSIIDWLCFLSLAMRATPFECLLDFICLSIELFFNERVSLQALQRKLPLTTAKCCFG